MAKHETIADIIAEIRALSNPISDGIIAINGSIIADRLEAALKRDTKELRVEIERLKEERNYSGVRERERLRAKGFAIVPKEQLERGDCAKLREALSDACYAMFNFLKVQNGGYEEISNVLDKAKAALAAPPRNCDVIGNTGRALAVHGFPTKSKPWGEGEWLKLIDWLFDTATEKEGGNDGDK